MTSVDDVKLARDVLTETLHGPVPMHTVARLAEAVIRLDAERQWRPLTEDPASWPEVGQDVAILWRDRRTSTGTFRAVCGANAFDRLITHWLPLPGPPKGEGK